jgi:hypothetical protein
VAKEGGKYRTIGEALSAITTNSESNHWTIKVGAGIYNEQIVLKPYINIIGSGQGITKVMSINKPVVLADLETTNSSSTEPTVSIENLDLQLVNDTLGLSIVEIDNTATSTIVTGTAPYLALENVNLMRTGEPTAESIAVKVKGNQHVSLRNISTSGVGYGVLSEVLSDHSATSTVDISFSQISSKLGDIRTVCLDVSTGEECTDETIFPSPNLPIIDIVSSYNTLTGQGTNFIVGKGTVISSAHDTYLNYSGEGTFKQNDYFRQITNADSAIFALQNAGTNLFTVSASGTVAVSPQNTSGDSFTINSSTASSTLTVINNVGGTALTVIGDIVIQSATSGVPVTIAAAGGEINLGSLGDTINLNISGVTYNFKENVRRDAISAYLSAPVSGNSVWGNGANAWSPAENITLLAVKVQYLCNGESGVLNMALKDRSGNIIADLDGYDCSGWSEIIVDNLSYSLTSENGMYLEVITASETVSNVTVTIEYVYDNR